MNQGKNAKVASCKFLRGTGMHFWKCEILPGLCRNILGRQQNRMTGLKKVWASGKCEEEIQGKRHGFLLLEFHRRLKSHSLEGCEIYVDHNQNGRTETGVLAQISFFPCL